MSFLFVIGPLNFDFSEKLWYNIYIRSGEAFFLSPLPTSPHAAVVELADTRDLKSLGGDLVPVRVRSAAPTDLLISSTFWQSGKTLDFRTDEYILGCRSKVRTVVSKITDVSSILTAPAIGSKKIFRREQQL